MNPSPAGSSPATRDPNFWGDFYLAGRPPWQLDIPCPPAFRLLDARKDLRPGAVLVVGCGLGLEPAELARRGFTVTGLDLCPEAVARARARAAAEGPSVTYLVGDVLALPAALWGAFDYVFEQTCFCAIAPGDRPAYVANVALALRDGGRLFGVFYESVHEVRPPFPVTAQDVRDYFGQLFELEVLERAVDSAPQRAGREHLALLRKRPSSPIPPRS